MSALEQLKALANSQFSLHVTMPERRERAWRDVLALVEQAQTEHRPESEGWASYHAETERHAETTAERDRLRAHISDCHELQNNVAAVLGVETDWDDAGRKAVVDAACRLTGNLADARASFTALGKERNTWARQLADLRDEADTAKTEREAMFTAKCGAENEATRLTVELDQLRATVERVQEAVTTFCHGEQAYAEHAHYCAPVLTALAGGEQ